MNWSLATTYFIALVGIVNPVAQIPLWASASAGEKRPVQIRLAIQVVLAASAILLLFLFLGPPLLGALGVGLPAFRFGGGIVILLIALAMLRGEALRFKPAEEDEPLDIDAATALRFKEMSRSVCP
jgi:multiple antibiotic resistance protein